MLDQLAYKFLQKHQEIDGLNLIHNLRCSGFYNIGMFIGKFIEKQFPYSSDIKDEYAMNAYYAQNYLKTFKIYNRLLSMKGLSENISTKVIFNQHFCINHVLNYYGYYNLKIVSKINTRKKLVFPLVTLTMTSCKRFDLFEQTVNSFLNCCQDLEKIDKWICIDDNSSQEDRDKMKKLYPFFIFYFKTQEEKGHPQSMNIIKKMVNTPYFFHMEDDWKFFSKRKYISDALDVMQQDIRIAQCLVNKNYSETESDVDIKGGEFHTTQRGFRYFIHEYFPNKNSIEKNCYYWPHFSFRPSLIRSSILEELGEFNEQISHFEMDYSYRYIKKGYISAFFEGIYCVHIGRLTSERHDKDKPNAYEMNNEAQFDQKECEITLKEFDTKLKTYVINLDRRPDRWEIFLKNSYNLSFLNFNRYSAVDGKNIESTDQLQRIFDGNDYNMRVGMVGCAMSHIKLYIEMLESDADVYCILEDDLKFVPNFGKKLLHVYEQIKNTDWDILYLGHHLFESNITDDIYNKNNLPIAEKWNSFKSLSMSMGGTGGYIISRTGALKLLNFINRTGMTNGIDTVQQKSADELNIYYTNPHLIYSECFRHNNNPDTDIQYDYDSLTVSVEKRLDNEVGFYGHLFKLSNFDFALEFAKNSFSNDQHYFQSTDPQEIYTLSKESVHPWYTLENSVIVIVPEGNNERYFDRLKKNGNFTITDSLVYKS
jgi:GR25 family glycosyltransferase involved in LPS biosynthesis